MATLRRRLAWWASRHRWLILVVLVAFVLRVGWLLYSRPLPVSDFGEYVAAAQTLREHGRFGFPEPNAFRLPAYPVLLAGLMVVSERIVWLSLWSVLLSTAVCWLLAVVAVRLGLSYRVAVGAALVHALLPNATFFAPVLASEHLLTVLVLSALVCATSEWSRPPARFLVVGLLIGAAALTRGDGLVYGAVIVGFAIVVMRRAPPTVRPSRSTVIRLVAAFALGTLVVVAPWVIRNEIAVGRGTMLGGRSAMAFFYAHNPRPGFRRYWDTRLSDLDEAAQQREMWRISFEYIRHHPWSLVSTTWRNMGDVFAPREQTYGIFWSTRQDASGYPIRPELAGAARLGYRLSVAAAWMLTAVPLLALWKPAAAGRRMLGLVGAVIAANWVFYCVIFLGVSRYRYLPDVFLGLPAAAGLALVGHARSSRRRRGTGVPASAPANTIGV